MGLAREVRLGVKNIDGRGARRIFHVKSSIDHCLVEIPYAARRNEGRPSTDNGLDLRLWHGFEDPFEDQEIHVFMAERKDQVIGKGIGGAVSFVKDDPRSLFPVTAADVLLRDATRPTDRPRNSEGMDECRPAGQSGAVGDGSILEDRDWSRVKFHRSTVLCLSRKQPNSSQQSRKRPILS